MNVQTDTFWRLEPISIHQWAFRISIGFSAQCTDHFTIDVRKGEMEEILQTDHFVRTTYKTTTEKMHRICEIPEQNPTINKMVLGSQMVALRQFFFLCSANGRKTFDKKKKKQKRKEVNNNCTNLPISPHGCCMQLATGTPNWIAHVYPMCCKLFRIGFSQSLAMSEHRTLNNRRVADRRQKIGLEIQMETKKPKRNALTRVIYVLI